MSHPDSRQQRQHVAAWQILYIVNLPIRYQRARKLNYHALNNGSDEEVPGEDHIFKKLWLTSQSTIDSFSSHELILPEDSASQVLSNLSKSLPKKKKQSDIDRCFDEDVVIIHDSTVKKKDCYYYGKDFIRINFHAWLRSKRLPPASEVAIEKLFNKGRDLLGFRRHSLNVETMRKLMLLRDMYINMEILKRLIFTNNLRITHIFVSSPNVRPKFS
jgi:hypothetical protein